MKYFLKTSTLVLTVTSMFFLTACSYKNPIEKRPEKEAIAFLTKASSYAEKKMGYSRTVGVMYQVCHKYKQDDPKKCPKIYNYIIEYAKSSDGKFSNLTREDLESNEAFERLRPYYASNNFNSIG
jgi:hypothetical protein